jgi:hypothetical protein
LDPYAIITYIVSYVSKDESGMTQFLQDVLKKNGKDDMNKLLRELKLAFLTHRQMGLAEAVYKLISGFLLKDSNITCIFLNTGFPENRSVFFKRIWEDNDVNAEFQAVEYGDEDAKDEEDFNESSNVQAITIEGRDGKYQQAVSIIDRYSGRPDCLKMMCLAQFATSYVSTSRLPKTADFDENGISKEFSSQKIFNTDIKLPKYIKLDPKTLGFIRLRTYPAVLRVHNSKRKDGHEQHYSELMLFCPWRDEVKEFHRGDAEKCINKYHEKKEEIDQNRKLIFPGEATIELMDSAEFELQRPSHVFDQLNAEGEQNNIDDNVEGIIQDPAFESHSYFGNLQQDLEGMPAEEAKYKEVALVTNDELLTLTRRLHSEQLDVLNAVVKYAKDVVKARNNFKVKPKPPLLVVHGGAGTEFKLIKCGFVSNIFFA